VRDVIGLPAPPTSWKLLLPGRAAYTPVPAYESWLVLASPVPTHIEPSAGSTASAPTERLGMKSKIACHV
jgi:hypothetical protein